MDAIIAQLNECGEYGTTYGPETMAPELLIATRAGWAACIAQMLNAATRQYVATIEVEWDADRIQATAQYAGDALWEASTRDGMNTRPLDQNYALGYKAAANMFYRIAVEA